MHSWNCRHAKSTRSARRPPVRSAWLGGLLAAGIAACAPAFAGAPIAITTTGVIASGGDTGDLLGLGTNLAGDSYQLVIAYDDPIGPGFYSDGSTVAEDFDPLTGAVVLTIDGKTLTAAISTSYGAQLVEDGTDLASANAGVDAVGNYVDASQLVSSANAFVPLANLQTGLSYTLARGDVGSDSFQFNNAAFTQTVSFEGTTTSIVLTSAVPEPASWLLMAMALAGLGFVARRPTAGRPRA